MAYLRNSAVNRLNLHYGIHSLAMGIGGVFFAVYLLKAGLSVPLALVAIAMIHVVRFVLRPLTLPAAKRWGVRPLIIFGTSVSGLQYLFLALVGGLDTALIAFIAVSALGETFYWTSYHAYFATVGDAEHRGHQVSIREALTAVIGIITPLMGGWMLTVFGPLAAFGTAGVLQALAALPLIGAADVAIAREAPGAFKAARTGVLLFASDGWIAASYLFVWQIFLFITLGESFTAYGGTMAIAALVGAVAGMILGRHIDSGRGERSAWLAFGAFVLTILIRAASDGPATAVTANALGALVTCLYVPAMMTAVYNMAKQSPCTMRFHVAAEGAWDAGCGGGCLVAAGLIALGVPFALAILLSLLGATAALVLLRHYYTGKETLARSTLSA